jgi:hypothetical protein
MNIEYGLRPIYFTPYVERSETTHSRMGNGKRPSVIQPAGHPILAVLRKVEETANLNRQPRLKTARSRPVTAP